MSDSPGCFRQSAKADISIHAPAKGATRYRASPVRSHGHFNPRSREGSDNKIKQLTADLKLFQSTLPRRERRLFVSSKAPYEPLFQSTLPRRERPSIRWTRPRDRYFNPRSREGSDASAQQRQSSRQYFNPRSREGSDLRRSPHTSKTIPFQSTLPRRERRNRLLIFLVRPVFQSTLP